MAFSTTAPVASLTLPESVADCWPNIALTANVKSSGKRTLDATKFSGAAAKAPQGDVRKDADPLPRSGGK
jgi:hypothetical protein